MQSDSSQQLLHACVTGSADQARGAIATGANVNYAWPGGLRALHLTAHRGDLILSELLLQHGAEANAVTLSGETAALAAAAGGHDAVLRLLARYGADLSMPGPLGLTPLHMAMQQQRFGTAQTLLWLDANPSARSLNGATPDKLAALDQQPDVLRTLFRVRRLSRLRKDAGTLARELRGLGPGAFGHAKDGLVTNSKTFPWGNR
jgi:ankyrin repeat protein